MATRPATHPSADTLQAFGLGKLDDLLAEAVMAHLDACADCRAAVAAQSGDDFLRRLRATHGRHNTQVPGKSLSGVARSLQPAAPPTPAVPPNVPPELADHPQYEVVRELGRGGMGVVYLARNKLMDRPEVLKVMNKELLERSGGKERFLREIQSAARLSHPNVVTAYSAVEVGELLVFAMEYIDGEDLARLVKALGPLPVANACYYAQQAALGLQHAFEKKMVHRDIKPQNLILARAGKKHQVKVLDFGLAKAARQTGEDHGLTGTGQMLGTPDYVAPEQILDATSADVRADIYSLGCTLYYLLTGGPPFRGKSLFEILQAHQSIEARPLNLARPEVPEELAAVVRKMMAKEPAKRFQTPIEVAQALAPFVKPGTKGAPVTGAAPALSQGTGETLYPQSAKTDPAAHVATSTKPVAGIMADKGKTRTDSTAAPSQPDAALEQGPEAAPKLLTKKTWLIGAGALAGVLLLGLLGLWAGGVFTVKTNEGILIIEVNEPKPDVFVDGDKVLVAWDDSGKKAEITVKPGAKVKVKKDGFTVQGDEVILEDGRRKLIARLDKTAPAQPPGGKSEQVVAKNPPIPEPARPPVVEVRKGEVKEPAPTKPEDPPPAVPIAEDRDTDALQQGTVWKGIWEQKFQYASVRDTCSFTVLKRDGATFKARLEIDHKSSPQKREVSGTIEKGVIKWLAKDVKDIQGGSKGYNTDGKITGSTLELNFKGVTPNNTKTEGLAKLQLEKK